MFTLRTCFHYYTDVKELFLAEDTLLGYTFLHRVAESRTATEMSDLLSEIPDEINAELLMLRTARGHTVLHRAAENKRDERMILLLLDAVRESFQTQGKCQYQLYGN